VLAKQADDYYYIPTLWAAMAGVIAPSALLLLPHWLVLSEILLIQVSLFGVLALLLRSPFLLRRLIPKQVRHWRASNLARRQFLENNLHHTEGGLGVLIFVSELERYVEILADRGVAEQIPNETWALIVQSFTQRVGQGEVYEGFDQCLQAVGVELAAKFPITQDKNELPNHLVLI
jgi:putative membrane protein